MANLILEGNSLTPERVKTEIKNRVTEERNDIYTRVIMIVGGEKLETSIMIFKDEGIVRDVGDACNILAFSGINSIEFLST